MKKALFSFVLLVLSTSVFAAKHNYSCIIETLEMENSDYYYALTPADIDAFLATDNDIRSARVRAVTKECDAKAKGYFKEVTTDSDATGTIEKTRMITGLSLDSADEATGKYELRRTERTRWIQNSKFIDVIHVSVDFGSQSGKNALVAVMELSSTGMGVKNTNMEMDCVKTTKEVTCTKAGTDSTFILSFNL